MKERGKVSFVLVKTRAKVMSVAGLAKEIWTDHYVPIVGRPQVEYMLGKFQTPAAISRQIQEGAAYFLMQNRIKRDVGYLALIPQEKNLFLSKIYIKKQVRGKGYGKEAIAFAESFARARALNKIALTVNRHNKETIGFYKRSGFAIAGAACCDIGKGFAMNDFRMEKKVVLSGKDKYECKK